MPNLGRAVLIATGFAWACACSKPLTPPERALRDYVHAAKAGDCDKAWAMTASRTKAALEYLACKGRSTPARAMLCNEGAFLEADADAPKTLSQTPDRATVAIQYEERHGPALPGFSGMLTRDRDQPFELVLEDGQWKVEESRVLERVEKERVLIRSEIERMEAEYARRGMPAPPRMREHCALQGGEA